MDVSNLADNEAYMHPTYYEKIKGIPILSTTLVYLVIDTMDIRMQGIIKRNKKWVEWTQERKKRTGRSSSMGGVLARSIELIVAMTIIATTTTSTGPLQSIGQGGDQPPGTNDPYLWRWPSSNHRED